MADLSRFGNLTSDISLDSVINLMDDKDDSNNKYQKGSAWLITINSNIALKDIESAEQVERARNITRNIREATDIIFSNERPDSHFDEVWQVIEPLIDSQYKVRDKPEVGTKYKRIHSHVVATWKHYGKIRMDYNRVRYLYNEYVCPSDGSRECYGVSKVHVHIKFMQMAVEGYLGKGKPIGTTRLGDRVPHTRLGYLDPPTISAKNPTINSSSSTSTSTSTRRQRYSLNGEEPVENRRIPLARETPEDLADIMDAISLVGNWKKYKG